MRGVARGATWLMRFAWPLRSVQAQRPISVVAVGGCRLQSLHLRLDTSPASPAMVSGLVILATVDLLHWQRSTHRCVVQQRRMPLQYHCTMFSFCVTTAMYSLAFLGMRRMLSAHHLGTLYICRVRELRCSCVGLCAGVSAVFRSCRMNVLLTHRSAVYCAQGCPCPTAKPVSHGFLVSVIAVGGVAGTVNVHIYIRASRFYSHRGHLQQLHPHRLPEPKHRDFRWHWIGRSV